jgi:hypothetical protein
VIVDVVVIVIVDVIDPSWSWPRSGTGTTP